VCWPGAIETELLAALERIQRGTDGDHFRKFWGQSGCFAVKKFADPTVPNPPSTLQPAVHFFPRPHNRTSVSRIVAVLCLARVDVARKQLWTCDAPTLLQKG